MKRRPNCQNGITKFGILSGMTTEKLGSSKVVKGNGKRSHEEGV